MRKICVVTATRAEYGLLKPIIEKIYKDAELELCLIVTGMHLSSEFGMTYKEIEEDGYPIAQKVEMLLSADTASGVLKSMGVEMIGFADVFSKECLDMVVLLGDRYETLIAAVSAMIHGIPISHIHGGELTEGLIDEAIRHSISKMSHLHFTSTEEYKKRVIQLGEQPDRVYTVGALGVESIKQLKLLSKSELESQINFEFSDLTAMVTYHPVTLENRTASEQFEAILNILDRHKEFKIIFTKANADMDGRIINSLIDEFVSRNKERSITFSSMGQLRYLSCLKYASLVIGNSSSGIIETASFKIPTINIGDRQKGRLAPENVIHCKCIRKEIEFAVQKGLGNSFKESMDNCKNPYGDGTAAVRIRNILNEMDWDDSSIVKKEFWDL